MKFFIPNIEDSEKWETIYEDFARACHRHPLPHGKRVRSITFQKSSTETWTATVGEKLVGKKIVSQGRGATRREYSDALSDGATVLAIFPGVPYMVVTNKGLEQKVRSLWENPFLAHEHPTIVEYFDPEDPSDDAPEDSPKDYSAEQSG